MDGHSLVRFGLTGLVGQEPDLEIVGDTRLGAEVLSLLGQGLSVRAIASSLCVSLSTAKTYVARLYEKLGATNRAQAIMTALKLGLLNSS